MRKTKPQGTAKTVVKDPLTPRVSGVSTTLLRACSVLRCFSSGNPTYALKQIAELVALPTTTAHRILTSLVQGEILELRSKNLYGRRQTETRHCAFRFGYAAQTDENSFSRLVTESVRSYAFSNGIELVLADNHYSAASAVRNAERFVREKVDVAIEFQSYESVASKVAAQLGEAGIPVIAIEIPHPGAIYFGANNYRAGLIGGRALSKACQERWQGRVDEILMLKQAAAGQVPHSRLDGTVAALRKSLPDFSESKLRIMEGQGRFESSLDATRRFLRRSRSKRLLVSGINDLTCLGALQAIREAGRDEASLIVGQNGSIEARLEMRKAGSPFVGSVAYFPERYGEMVIALALDVLRGKQPPAATFTEHVLLTRSDVDKYYPNDLVESVPGKDSLLMSLR
jgi:ribose transport system substrate-binding protein